MSTIVADHEFAVPARFVALFRAALADELCSDAGWVADQGKELVELFAGAEYAPDLLDRRLVDLGGAGRCLFEDYMLLMQACEHEDPSADMTVKGSHEALRGALEQTIRCASRRIADAAGYSPIEAETITSPTAGATWAANELERLDKSPGGGGES
jgi:hypothetical protein